MHEFSRRSIGSAMLVSAVCSTMVAAQAAPGTRGGSSADVCALASNEEFQQLHGVDPRIGIIPEDPTLTQMRWGPHCDYTGGSIDLFTVKSPAAELERVLALTKAVKQRDPVGLGDRAFFTMIYPDDEYRRRGLLAVFLGPRVVTFSMDPYRDEPLEATRPKLEKLAKLALPRLK